MHDISSQHQYYDVLICNNSIGGKTQSGLLSCLLFLRLWTGLELNSLGVVGETKQAIYKVDRNYSRHFTLLFCMVWWSYFSSFIIFYIFYIYFTVLHVYKLWVLLQQKKREKKHIPMSTMSKPKEILGKGVFPLVTCCYKFRWTSDATSESEEGSH